MILRFSEALKKDLATSLEVALAKYGIVNIPFLAEEIRQRHVHENVALEDIASELLRFARIHNAAMEFDAGNQVTASFG